MLTSDFDYHLPPELIAQFPLSERTSSKLLCVNKKTGEIKHQSFFNLVDLLKPNDLLVFNNTRVMPARLYAKKITGGKIEILIERILTSDKVIAHVKSNKSLKIPTKIVLENDVEAEIINRCGDLFELIFAIDTTVTDLLHEIGEIPLPKYIHRDTNEDDNERYQTVYASQEGAVAAPTAGLHFDHHLLTQIKQQGINIAFVTLHVGAGTFKPVQTENITQHKMHSEYIEVSQQVCDLVAKTREKAGRIIAVGTTTVRALESATNEAGEINPYQGETQIFIYPGYKFRCIDTLITNFHLPKSSLLMLVCALGGYDTIFKAYEQAIKNQYRFYSYGDAMWID